MTELKTEAPTAADFYGSIAAEYGALFTDAASLDENRKVFDIIGLDMWDGENILDLGCGLGLLLDYVDVMPSKYMGLDISPQMLAIARKKHPAHLFRLADISDHQRLALGVANTGRRKTQGIGAFGFVVSTFGALSYVEDLGALLRDVASLLHPAGKLFFMVYQDGYQPYTHERYGLTVPHATYTMQEIRDLIEPDWKRGMVLDLGDFVGAVGLELEPSRKGDWHDRGYWLGL